MQSPMHVHKTVRGNRLKIALFSLGLFIVVVAGFYYFLSFKKTHITPTLEGTWVCKQYLDSIAAKRSVAAIKAAPMFVQISFKKGWVDSVMGTGLASTYKMMLIKQKKGKYLLTRFTDTIGTVKLKKIFTFEEKWSGSSWAYTKADTAFKGMDKGKIFHRLLNRILIAGKYTPLQGKSLLKEVEFSDSGTVNGIKGFKEYKLCYGIDCLRPTLPKDAIFMSGAKNTVQLAFDRVADTLNVYTIARSDTANHFKLYWKLLELRAKR